MKLAVILFAYKRPRILKRVLKTHYKIDADYYCFIDYSEMQNEIYEIVKSKNLYTFFLRDKINWNNPSHKLNSNITTGITEVFKMGYDAVIVLEDDILIKPGSLEWLKEQFEVYKHTESFGAVSLDKDKFMGAFKCWGWGTWKDRWQAIDWRLKVSGKYKSDWDKTHSWDFYVAFWFDVQGLFTRCHPKGLSKHIGHIGVHHKWYSVFGVRQYLRKLKSYL